MKKIKKKSSSGLKNVVGKLSSKRPKKEKKVLTKPEKKRKVKKILKGLFNLCLVFMLLVLTFSIVFSIYIVIKAPDFNPDKLYRAESSIIYDKNGNEVAKLGIEKRKKVTYDQLPEVLVDAIVATEDSRYFQHNGFDLPRFTKAALGQVAGKLLHRGGNAGGGSTITMQVNKNNYTTSEVSITRKFTDIYMAIFKIEKNYSKEEIMEYYVNTSFLGNESYGVEQACQTYFGKSVSDIGLAEASIIAGLFQAPSAYDPYRHPEETKNRQLTVLYLMKKHGYITQEQYDIVKDIPIENIVMKSNPMVENNKYQSYIDLVLNEIEEKTGKSPYTTAMKIYTNLDTDKQNILSDIMDGKTWTWKDDKVQAGIAIVDTHTGALLAVGGGRNHHGERLFNYAADINRQIGSTAKPLFDYGPAFEYEGAGLASQVFDAPTSYSSGTSIKNADGVYKGVITYKYALAASRNVPALKVFQKNNNEKVKEFVTSLGITPEIDAYGGLHEAHAVGSFNGSNPVQMAGAYAAFGNGGYFTKPYTVTSVVYIDTGKTVSLKNKTEKVMSDSTAYMITDALLYAVNGYGNINGSVSGVQLAAKTGTSSFSAAARKQYGYPFSANMDMWVTGYTPEYAVSLWYGYTEAERGYYLANDGYTARGKLYRQIIADISDRSGSKRFSVPSSVVKVTVEKESSPLSLPSANTPGDMKVTEYFKRGSAPSKESPRYYPLNNVTGLSAKENGNNVTLSWNAVAVPDYLTDEQLKESLKDLYGKNAEEEATNRKNALGAWGYEVIEVNKDTGEETSLGFTSNTTYSVTRKKYNATYIVKTRWQNDTITRASGVSVDVKAIAEETTPLTFTNSFSYNPVRYVKSTKAFVDSTNTKLDNLKNDVVVKDSTNTTVANPSLTLSCSIPCNSDGTPKSDEDLMTYTITYTLTYGGKTYKLPTTRTVNIGE